MPALQLVAVILTALVFVPYGAHLFELPNKIRLSEQEYFVAQAIYSGWAWFGAVIFAAIIANLVAAAVAWRKGGRFWPNLAAGLIVAATLAVFFSWTYPVNQQTHNWTVANANWESLRSQWEYSHAANAVLAFAALCCAALSAIGRRSI